MADTDLLDDEDDFDPYADDVQEKASVPLEQLLRKRPQASPADVLDDDPFDVAGADLTDDESFYSPTPRRAADNYARRRDPVAQPQSSVSLEDQLRAKPSKALPGTTVDYSGAYDMAVQATPRTKSDMASAAEYGIPDADMVDTTSEVRPKQGVSSPDHKANFQDFVKLNPELFGDIQEGVDPRNPNAVSQFNQAQFWARVQSIPGGIEKFNKLPAPTKTAVLRKFSDDRMREMFPGYGRGQKMPAQAKEMSRAIYNDMRAATALELNGVPKARLSTIVGETPDDTISNVLKSPEIDRDFMDNLEPGERAKYLSAFINRAAGRDQKLRAELKFQLSPLLLDKGGENYTKHTERLFPKANGADPKKDPDQGWIAGTMRQALDTTLYVVAEGAKAPGYIVGGVGAVGNVLGRSTRVNPDDVTGAEDGAFGSGVDSGPKDMRVPNALADAATWWVDGINNSRDRVTSQKSIDRRNAFGTSQSKALDGDKALTGKIADFMGVMASNPGSSLEQIAGMLGTAVAGGGIGGAVAKGTAQATGKEAVKQSTKTLSIAGSSAATTAGQVQNDIFTQLHPKAGSTAYDLAKYKYSSGELSKARKAEAKEKGYEYDLGGDFEQWARDTAATGGAISGMLQLGFAMRGGSIEKLLAGEVAKGAVKEGGKKAVAKQAGQTAVVEGLTEALQEYSAGVTTAYYEKVRDEYNKTGDADKMIAALQDGRAAVQASIGLILGGAVGGGFGAMHALHSRGPEAAAEIIKDTEQDTPDTSGPVTPTDTSLDPATAQAIASQRASAVQAADGVIYTGPLESQLRRPRPTDESGPIPPTVTPLDPTTAQAVAKAYGTQVPASDGVTYSGSLESQLRKQPAPSDEVDPVAEKIGATREARSLEQQLAASEPAPVDRELTEAELIAMAENDPATIDAEARLEAHVAARQAMERELSSLKKNTTPAGIRRKAQLKRDIEANKATTAPLQTEVDNLTRSGGKFTKVQVRDADGKPTGVEMDRTEFDDLESKQKDTVVAAANHEARAKSLADGVDAPVQRIAEIAEQKKQLAGVMLAEQQQQRANAISVAEQRVELMRVKVEQETKFLADLTKGKTAEQLLSRDYKRAKENARKRLNAAKGKLADAEVEFDKADNSPEPSLARIHKSDEYKARQAQLDTAIGEQKGAAAVLTEEAKKATSAAQEVKDDFKAEEGFDADKTYTNRQAGVATAPITDTSVRRVLDQFATAVKGVGGKPIHVEVIRTDADFTALEGQYGEFPNKSFSTIARVDGKGDGKRSAIYVNAMRVEDAEAGKLMDELVSKAASQFVLPQLARSDNRFQVILANIARSASRSTYGRRVEAMVSDGFYANGVSPDQRSFNLSFVAELIRTAPKSIDANGNVQYNLERSFFQRASAAIGNYLVRRWPGLSSALGIRGTVSDIGIVNSLLSQMVRTDDLGHLPAEINGDWTSLFTEGRLDRQKREFINTSRYAGGVGWVMQQMKDRAALTLALDAVINKVSRGVAQLPAGVNQTEAITRLQDAHDAVELRVRRTDNRIRNEARPLADEFQAAMRAAAEAAGESVVDFTQKFDTYVQLVSIQEMLSTSGDFYLSKVKLSKDAKREFDERIKKLALDQKTVHDVEGRARLGREARTDIDRIVQLDQAGKEPPRLMYAGFTRDSVAAELVSNAKNTPALKAAFDQAYPAFRRVMDRTTEISYESSDYDPLDIAFRGRKHFVYRGGQEIDASKTKELSELPGKVIGGRKSVGGADETFAAVGRRELPKNASVTAVNELIRSIERAELGKVAAKLEFASQVDTTLAARGEEATRHTRSTPSAFTSSSNFDFDYVGAASEGSTKSLQFIRDDGTRGVLTFAHEDILNGLRQHSVEGKYMGVMAAVQGQVGSLYTTRNPVFVVTRQAPRDMVHNTFGIIIPRHGVKAAAAYQGAVASLAGPITKYTKMDAAGRAEYIAKLPAAHPLRRYIAQGGWFGAHAQHSAADLAAKFTERSKAERVLQSIPIVKHALDTLPEAMDNLFRVAYFDVVTRKDTKNNLDDAKAAVRAGRLMDFSSGSSVQRAVSPWVPFARAWTNGAYNLMFHDTWRNGVVPTREVNSVDGRKAVIDWSRVREQQTLQSALPVMALTSASLYALSRAMAGPDDPPPTADELANGIILPGGYTVQYQFGITKIFGALGALSAAAADGLITESKAALTFANVWAKEASPLGLQFVPTTDQSHWATTLLSQAFGANAFTKLVVPPAINVDNFGRTISRPGGKASTPDAYKSISEDNPDTAAYVLRQFGLMSSIFDLAMRENSTNQTDEQLARARGKVTGGNSFKISGFGVQEQVRGQEDELVDDYRHKLDKVKRTPDKKDDFELRKSTPNGANIEAYLKLNQRLTKEYSTTRKKWVGKPEFSEKMATLNKRHRETRSAALVKLREKQAQMSSRQRQ